MLRVLTFSPLLTQPPTPLRSVYIVVKVARRRFKLVCFARSHAFVFHTVAELIRPLFFLSLHLPCLAPGSAACAQAVSAEAATMSTTTPTDPEVKELNPVDFIQLQQYIECEYGQAARREGSFSQRLTT